MDTVELFTYRAANLFANAVAKHFDLLGYNVVAQVVNTEFAGPSCRQEESDDYCSDASSIREQGALFCKYKGLGLKWIIGRPDSYSNVTVKINRFYFGDGLTISYWKMTVPEMNIFEDSDQDICEFYGSIPSLRAEISKAITEIHRKMGDITNASYDETPKVIEDPENEIEVFQNLLRELIVSYR